MVKRAILSVHRLAFEGGALLNPDNVAEVVHNIRTLMELGVRELCVVDGEHAEELETAIRQALGPELGLVVLANRSWRHALGSDLSFASDFLRASSEPCLVLSGGQAQPREALIALLDTELGPYDAVLAVQPNSGERLDAVAVRMRRVGRGTDSAELSALGFDLEGADTTSMGMAVVTPRILDCLAHVPNPSLEDGLEELLNRGALVRAISCEVSVPVKEVAARHCEQVAAILDTKGHPRYNLFNPGPVNTTSNVKSAMVHHDVCHRDSSFSELMVSLGGKLQRIFKGSSQHTVCLVTGSGTAAMESAIASSVPRDAKILVVDNGAFGERILEVASVHEMDVVHLRYAWGDLVKPEDIEQALDDHPEIAVVAMVHHETSVGLLNPIKEIGEVTRRYDALLIVDAVSSLGAEELDVVRDNIDICYASANKCLHAISGAGFLCVSPRTWKRIEHIKPRSYYLDLNRYRRYAEELGQTPFTPAVSTYFALDAACGEFLEDGHAKRWAMYRRRNQTLRQGLSDLGMVSFTRTGFESNSVVTCAVPDGVSYGELYDGLKACGYIVYGCKDVLADRFLQVANMGELAESEIDAFLATCKQVITEIRARRVSLKSA